MDISLHYLTMANQMLIQKRLLERVNKNILYDIANSQLSFISKIITLYQSAQFAYLTI